MCFRARHAQVVCGSEEAARMGLLRGLKIDGEVVPSGTPVEPGTLLLTLSGRAADLHRVWKPAQTLMEYAGGIASATAELLAAARRGNPGVRVACTRKHLPGSKSLSVKAILCGGAAPHRLGISDTLLVFAEHRAFLGDLPPDQAVTRLKQAWPERQVVVEVASADEAALWMDAGADVIQLEKCSPDVVAQVVARAGTRHCQIAVAGGVNAGNAQAYAATGAQILVSSAPYQGAPRDVAVTVEAASG
jgi:molybdenum transport protein